MPRSRSSKRSELVSGVMMAGRELSTAAVMFQSALAARSGLTAVETKAVDILERHGPMTQQEFGKRSGLARASVSGLMDRLERKGFARRVPHPSDKRKVLITSVPEPVTEGAPMFGDLMERISALCADYTDDELQLITDFTIKAAHEQRLATAHIEGRDEP